MAIDPLNKLCKWRMVFAGWLGGTKTMNEGGARAARDWAEKWLIMRAEMNALIQLLVEAKVITFEQFQAQVQFEAELLDRQMERNFPGFRSTDVGMEIYDAKLAAETTKRLGFPP
jgi:hypothetical protein